MTEPINPNVAAANSQAAVSNPSPYIAEPQSFTANLFLDSQQLTSTVFRSANQTLGINKS
jgi:hypothetical protein